MTSKKAMLIHHAVRRALWSAWLLAAGAGCIGSIGCEGMFARPLDQPHVYPSPYAEPMLLAVVPFQNDTGTLLVDPVRFADQLTNELQQIEGIDVLPVNRVLEAMAATRMDRVASVSEAMMLMGALRVDGLVVGTLTAYDPYDPPKMGAAMQLYLRKSPTAAAEVDPRTLTTAATTPGPVSSGSPKQPVTQVAGYFDAANGAVLQRLEAYAHGRTPPDSAAGWRRYLLNIDLYSQFVSHEMMRRMFASEWDRLAPTRPDPQQASKNADPVARASATGEARKTLNP